MATKEPIAKLPLAVRKNVRDEWENKKADKEGEVSKLLGVPWTFDINPNAIFPYAEENSYGFNSLGACIMSYVDGAIYHLKRYVDSHSQAGKDEINSVCTTHTITLSASTKFSYCGCEIADGKLNMVFHPNNLGTNIDQALYEIATVVSEAPQPAGAPKLSFAARHAVAQDYDTAIGPVLEKARKALQNPALQFEPDFEALGQMLKGGKDVRDDWERNLGSFTVKYYESFADALAREKFGDDEMLREGFEEGVPKGVVRFKILEKMDGYNGLVLEGGELVMQTTPAYFGTNIDQTAHKLVDLL